MTDPSEQTPLRSRVKTRKTTVEDASDSDDHKHVATSTATASSAKDQAKAASSSSKSPSSSNTESSDKVTGKDKIPRRQQQQQRKSHSQFKSIAISLLIASLGVLLKSGYEKFLFPGRDIAIQQTVGIQGNCYQTAFIPGPADIEISDKEEIAFVSSDDRSWKKTSRFFHRPSMKTLTNGGIYTLSLNEKNSKPRQTDLKGYDADDFHPAGISLFGFRDDDTGAWTERVFVINHSHRGDSVEIFDYSAETNTLTFVKSVSSKLFVTPRDVVAVDKERFYLTNHNASQPALESKYGRVAEEIAGLALGSVVYYNGKETRKVLESLSNPYGIAISPDAKQIYVSSFLDKTVRVYNTTTAALPKVEGQEGEEDQGELIHDADIWVGNHVDNLSVDRHTGDIYVASHPSYSTYLRHKLGYEPQSPSHVVKIEKLSPENYIPQESSQPDYYFFPKPELPPIKWEVKDLFYSNGEDISASSVAAFWKNDLILGSTSSHHLLRCSLSLEH
ncbi:hypothetical protein BGW38_010610 [Lunasporangiospora selenospora]|uniref:Uncharacterized protein n=1 Tax=Lunasporangiospora selenospora TaxID=979761 RepID=A0A9P6FXH8_9FUNG|nr:hypothetical protein BGW38_010610 [Lunasporangiospora selenospora]